MPLTFGVAFQKQNLRTLEDKIKDAVTHIGRRKISRDELRQERRRFY